MTILCHKDKIEKLKALNADKIVDYTSEDITESTDKYDVIFDSAAYRPAKDYEPILAEKGVFVSNGGSMKHLFKVILFGKLMSKKNGITYTNFLARPSAKDLEILAQLMAEGKVKAIIDKEFSLEHLEKAFLYYKSRKAAGKIVIKM